MYGFKGKEPVVGERVFLAPGCHIVGDVILEDDAAIWFNAVLRGDIEKIKIGARSNVQEGCVIHTDRGFPAIIGADVTVGHRAVVHGAIVEDHVLVGMGALVLTGARIGRGSVIAAGSVVPEGREIPPDSLVMGVPGRVVRCVSDSERRRVTAGSQGYVQRKDAYLQAGIQLSP